MDNSASLFSEKQADTRQIEANESRLYEQIGKLQMHNGWLKKFTVKCSMAERKDMVVKDSRISIVEQCGLLSIHRNP